MNLRFLHPVQAFAFLLLAPLPAQSASDYTTPYAFTTMAGLSSVGSNDGPGATARFFSPVGAATDAAGNLYIADHDNNMIRKISPAGVVSTIAGAPGVRGSSDGKGAEALLINPAGLAVDAAGNVFVADKINQTIRKITPDGTVSTFAGSPGKAGFVDGVGTAARFQIPTDVVIDATGNLYVADQINNAIRKITPDGTVTTFAGRTNGYTSLDGPVDTAGFFYPSRLALDGNGVLYVGEAGNVIIRKISAGVVTTFAGKALAFGADDGAGANARFRGIGGLAVDRSGNVWVSDSGNGTIRRITPDGNVTTALGQPGEFGSADGSGTTARFNSPSGLAFDQAGNLHVTDSYDNTVRKITPGLVVTTLAGLPRDQSAGSTDGTIAAARFKEMAGTAVNAAGDVYVADTINSTVRKIARDGTVTTLAGKAGTRGTADGPGADARFDSPYGIAVSADGTIYVSDAAVNTIRRITPAGVVTTLAGDPAAAPGSANGSAGAARFNYPAGLALGPDGALYVADRDNHLVRKVTATGSVTTVAGTAGSPGQVDGQASTAHFNSPVAVATDPTGNVYVAEGVKHGGIRKISAAGLVSTLAGGSGGLDDAVDGQGAAARFKGPTALVADAAGNLFVSDGANCTVRKVSATGQVTTLAGLAAAAGNADGAGSKSRFFYPLGLSVDGQGSLYLTSGTTVRRGVLATAPVITTQPASQSITAGGSVQFSVTASGAPAPTYQWQFNGAPLAGATGSTLALTSARPADAGEYTVVVTNEMGVVTSTKATLAVTAAPAPPPSVPTGGGGGGAPSGWFIGALAALGFGRKLAGCFRAGR